MLKAQEISTMGIRGEGKTRETCMGEGEPRGFIAQNPRKVRGVHALRGNPGNLPFYHY